MTGFTPARWSRLLLASLAGCRDLTPAERSLRLSAKALLEAGAAPRAAVKLNRLLSDRVLREAGRFRWRLPA